MDGELPKLVLPLFHLQRRQERVRVDEASAHSKAADPHGGCSADLSDAVHDGVRKQQAEAEGREEVLRPEDFRHHRASDREADRHDAV